MNENTKIQISDERVRELAQQVKGEISKLKRKIFLGVFNDRISVLLSSEHENVPMLFLRPNNLNERFRIHFDDPDGEWWISVSRGEQKDFTFFIPRELKSIVASISDPQKFLDMKMQFMSTLVVTGRFENAAITVRLKLDTDWVNSLRTE